MKITTIHRLVLATLAVGFLTMIPIGYAKNKRNFPKERWTVQYLSGTTSVQDGLRLSLSVVDRERVSRVRGLDLSIPFTRLAAVYFDKKDWRQSVMIANMPRSGCHYADFVFQDQTKLLTNRPGNQEIIATPADLNAIGAFAERLLFHYPIALFWYKGTTEEGIIINANECEYGPLVSLIQRVSGLRWTSLRHNWSTVNPGRGPMQSNEFSVRIDRRVAVGSGHLNPGSYRILLLDTPGGQKILLFFDVNRHIKIMVKGHATPRSNGPPGIHLSFKAVSGTAFLDQIDTPSIALTIENRLP